MSFQVNPPAAAAGAVVVTSAGVVTDAVVVDEVEVVVGPWFVVSSCALQALTPRQPNSKTMTRTNNIFFNLFPPSQRSLDFLEN